MRVRARRKSLEVVAVARWGVKLRDLDMLAAEKERWRECDEAMAMARGEDGRVGRRCCPRSAGG